MTGGGILGGGVIFVIAAVLWAAVLVPTWLRRREFRVSEQNALRLQRTVRVLAESAEIPGEVRLEASARDALAQEKLLASAERRQESERAAELSEARAAERRAEILAVEALRREKAAGRAARLRAPAARRLRSGAALVALLGVIGTIMGAAFAVTGLGASVLGASVLVFFAATGGLVLLAPGRAKHDVALRLPEVSEIPAAQAPVAEMAAERVIGRTAAAHAEVQAAAAERIERARAHARARAAAIAASPREPQADSMLLAEPVAASNAESVTGGAEVTQKSDAPASPTAPRLAAARRTPTAQRTQELSAALRLQGMGVVGDTSTGLPDLDAVMRRRREVG